MDDMGLGDGAYQPSLLDVATGPDDVAAWAASVRPGSAVVRPLVVLDPARLSHGGRLDALAALDKQLAWLQAAQLRLLAVLGAQDHPLDKEWVREDVAAALRLAPGTAADRLELAREMSRLPATMALLNCGEITIHHARVLAEAVCALDDTTTAAVEAAVLPTAPSQSPARFRKTVARAVLTAAPKRAEERHAEAMTQRRVAIIPVADGMSELWALLPVEGAAALKVAIDAAAARRDPGDSRTADQRRADALIDLALRRAVDGGGGALRPGVQVTVALSTLVGLDEQPAELDGYGPIPATLARRIAADPSGTWRRLVTDEHGQLLDYGRSTYRPPADLARHVLARDATCRFPQCGRTAGRCHLDHVTAWEDGGRTAEANLQALCARHHHLKHESGWQVTREATGTTRWVSPTGRTYQVEPARYPVDHTVTGPPGPDPPT